MKTNVSERREQRKNGRTNLEKVEEGPEVENQLDYEEKGKEQDEESGGRKMGERG